MTSHGDTIILYYSCSLFLPDTRTYVLTLGDAEGLKYIEDKIKLFVAQFAQNHAVTLGDTVKPKKFKSVLTIQNYLNYFRSTV